MRNSRVGAMLREDVVVIDNRNRFVCPANKKNIVVVGNYKSFLSTITFDICLHKFTRNAYLSNGKRPEVQLRPKL